MLNSLTQYGIPNRDDGQIPSVFDTWLQTNTCDQCNHSSVPLYPSCNYRNQACATAIALPSLLCMWAEYGLQTEQITHRKFLGIRKAAASKFNNGRTRRKRNLIRMFPVSDADLGKSTNVLTMYEMSGESDQSIASLHLWGQRADSSQWDIYESVFYLNYILNGHLKT